MEFKIKKIAQIELTNHCNLKCPYCPHGQMELEKEFMSMENFEKALDWVEYYMKEYGQDTLWLHGLGETLMVKNLEEYVEKAREVLGWQIELKIGTNIALLDDDTADMLGRYNVKLDVTLHRPDKAYKGYFTGKKHGIIKHTQVNPLSTPMSWAGQVDFPDSQIGGYCGWLMDAMVYIAVDGSIISCCLDATKRESEIGTVHDEPGTLSNMPHNLCKTCHEGFVIHEGKHITLRGETV